MVHAIDAGYLEVVDFLLSRGASPGALAWLGAVKITALAFAEKRGRADIVHALLEAGHGVIEAGADHTQAHHAGVSPADLTKSTGHEPVAAGAPGDESADGDSRRDAFLSRYFDMDGIPEADRVSLFDRIAGCVVPIAWAVRPDGDTVLILHWHDPAMDVLHFRMNGDRIVVDDRFRKQLESLEATDWNSWGAWPVLLELDELPRVTLSGGIPEPVQHLSDELEFLFEDPVGEEYQGQVSAWRLGHEDRHYYIFGTGFITQAMQMT